KFGTDGRHYLLLEETTDNFYVRYRIDVDPVTGSMVLTRMSKVTVSELDSTTVSVSPEPNQAYPDADAIGGELQINGQRYTFHYVSDLEAQSNGEEGPYYLFTSSGGQYHSNIDLTSVTLDGNATYHIISNLDERSTQHLLLVSAPAVADVVDPWRDQVTDAEITLNAGPFYMFQDREGKRYFSSADLNTVRLGDGAVYRIVAPKVEEGGGEHLLLVSDLQGMDVANPWAHQEMRMIEIDGTPYLGEWQNGKLVSLSRDGQPIAVDPQTQKVKIGNKNYILAGNDFYYNSAKIAPDGRTLQAVYTEERIHGPNGVLDVRVPDAFQTKDKQYFFVEDLGAVKMFKTERHLRYDLAGEHYDYSSVDIEGAKYDILVAEVRDINVLAFIQLDAKGDRTGTVYYLRLGDTTVTLHNNRRFQIEGDLPGINQSATLIEIGTAGAISAATGIEPLNLRSRGEVPAFQESRMPVIVTIEGKNYRIFASAQDGMVYLTDGVSILKSDVNGQVRINNRNYQIIRRNVQFDDKGLQVYGFTDYYAVEESTRPLNYDFTQSKDGIVQLGFSPILDVTRKYFIQDGKVTLADGRTYAMAMDENTGRISLTEQGASGRPALTSSQPGFQLIELGTDTEAGNA
ncbi:MAG: hypothetical protein HYZ85_00235, partial [Candidatus Omnitrophica bacterium]|nr:hypothetical protein [Candidatus Omnitrophota bacterium]